MSKIYCDAARKGSMVGTILTGNGIRCRAQHNCDKWSGYCFDLGLHSSGQSGGGDRTTQGYRVLFATTNTYYRIHRHSSRETVSPSTPFGKAQPSCGVISPRISVTYKPRSPRGMCILRPPVFRLRRVHSVAAIVASPLLPSLH